MSNNINPYAPPSAASLDPTRPSFGPPQPVERPFADPSFWSLATSALTALVILSNFGLIAVLAMTNSLLSKMAGGYQPSQMEIDVDTLRTGGAQVAVGGLSLMAAIAFFVWTYRVAANLPSLKAPKQEFSPGWAVGYYFIPIMNLFKPYQALVEIWKGSDPGRYLRETLAEQSTAIVGWWWAAHILAAIASRVVTATANAPNPTPDSLVSQNLGVIFIILILEVPRDLLTIWIVRKLSDNQLSRHQLVEEDRTKAPVLAE
jgi:hypothetical protein